MASARCAGAPATTIQRSHRYGDLRLGRSRPGAYVSGQIDVRGVDWTRSVLRGKKRELPGQGAERESAVTASVARTLPQKTANSVARLRNTLRLTRRAGRSWRGRYARNLPAIDGCATSIHGNRAPLPGRSSLQVDVDLLGALAVGKSALGRLRCRTDVLCPGKEGLSWR